MELMQEVLVELEMFNDGGTKEKAITNTIFDELCECVIG